jgi:hypothetical protein
MKELTIFAKKQLGVVPKYVLIANVFYWLYKKLGTEWSGARKCNEDTDNFVNVLTMLNTWTKQ